MQRNSSPDGEIGRHKRLKISRFIERAGSIPAPGTMHTAAEDSQQQLEQQLEGSAQRTAAELSTAY